MAERPFYGNCDTGVTDIDLLDERFAPVQEGSRIRITDLFGRARLHKYKLKNGAQRFARSGWTSSPKSGERQSTEGSGPKIAWLPSGHWSGMNGGRFGSRRFNFCDSRLV